MPLLLLLSALLSALSGAVAGVRTADVQIARQSQVVDVRRIVAAIAPAVPAHAHLLGAFGRTVRFVTQRSVAVRAVAAPRLYLDRLRA